MVHTALGVGSRIEPTRGQGCLIVIDYEQYGLPMKDPNVFAGQGDIRKKN